MEVKAKVRNVMKQKKDNKENVHIEMTMKSFVHFSKVVQKWNNENSAREKESKKERGVEIMKK
jgi:hypothetical protein